MRLVGDAVLSTAFLTYAGPFNREFRARLLDTWKRTLHLRKIPSTSRLELTHLLVEPTQVTEFIPLQERVVKLGVACLLP